MTIDAVVSLQAFIGDKYGHSPIVTSIEVEEFDLLHQVAQVVSKHVALLDCSYALDRNASPVAYTLRPATFKFPYYNDSTEENRTKREEVSIHVVKVSFIAIEMFRINDNFVIY